MFTVSENINIVKAPDILPPNHHLEKYESACFLVPLLSFNMVTF